MGEVADTTEPARNDVPMQLDVWSDIACPFCFIGKRSLEGALAVFPHGDAVEVRWRSFQLAPDMPAVVEGNVYEQLARKYGTTEEEARTRSASVEQLAAQSGLEMDLASVRPANTRDAHRLIQLAIARGLGDAMVERLFRAYFTEGATVSDHETLVALGSDAGLEADEAREVLGGDAFAAETAADQQLAAGIGLQAVPAFVIDRRFGLTGAQPPEVLVEGLERAYQAAREGTDPGA